MCADYCAVFMFLSYASKVVAVICVVVVCGQETTEKVATLGRRVILPCYIDVADEPENVPVIS